MPELRGDKNIWVTKKLTSNRSSDSVYKFCERICHLTIVANNRKTCLNNQFKSFSCLHTRLSFVTLGA